MEMNTKEKRDDLNLNAAGPSQGAVPLKSPAEPNVGRVEGKSLYETFLAGAAIGPDNPALLYKGKTVSYRNFVKSVDLLAAALLRFGIKPGDIVTASLPNIPKTAYLLYAANKIGAVLYFRHALNTPAETIKGLEKTGSAILFTLDTAAAGLENYCAEHGIRLISCCPADELGGLIRAVYRRREGLKTPRPETDKKLDYHRFIKEFPAAENNESAYAWDPRATAVLLDSGGTTGNPKTVCLSASAINALGAAGTEILCKEAADLPRSYLLSPLPVFHSFGLTMGLHAMVMHGGCNVFMPRFSRKDSIRYLKKGQVNFIIGVPAVFDALLSRPEFSGKLLKNIDGAYVGGDSLPPRIKTEFDRRMKETGSRGRLFEGYGLSETLSVVCVNRHTGNREGTVGKPLSVVSLRAVPTGADADELCVCGNILMNGYYRDEEATQAAFFTDADGTRWLRTGDLGRVDKDGYVYFLGRIKNIIKVSGESVFPVEIENAACTVPGVKAAAAYPVPDPKTGSRVNLAVETEPGADKSILREKIHAHLQAELVKNALPAEIDFYDELPRTKLAKVDKTALLRSRCPRQ